MGSKIVIVEDEEKISRVLQEYLTLNGFTVHTIADGAEALTWLLNNPADLVLLDIMLPSIDGITICRELRKHSDIPIIMVTAKVEEIDRLLGLEMGADDYICKPFSPREVVARVKAVLRRFAPKESNETSLYLISESHRVVYGDSSLELTLIEFQLLEMLISQPGRIYTRQQLMDYIYKDGRIVSDRTVDSHVKKLRQKLKGMMPKKEPIHSVYGIGYKFELEDIE
ncbi:MAG: response regulator [Thiotrichaceae bacterium]